MKQLWLFRICLCLALFVAANRIFAFSETNTKAKYTLQAQTADEEEEDEVDVLVPALTPIWEFSKMVSANLAILANNEQFEASVSIPRFIRFRNLRL